ncbi:MAG: DNA glycosylase AlkZ-like family protein, partial [Candidatus Limnocylindria bacterium]
MKPPTLRISLQDARRLAVSGQRLAGGRPKPTRAGAMEVVRSIGYLQLDPTNVVARNPQQIVWSRLGSYDVTILEDLLVKHRELFETVSLILPTSDLALHHGAMRAYRRATDLGPRPVKMAGGYFSYGAGAGGGTWPTRAAKFLHANPQLRRYVLTRLKREGPLPLTAFEDRSTQSWTSGGWNDERNVTMMLAILMRRGEVVVAGRRRGHKLWGLADGWLPVPERLSPLEIEKRATERAIRSLGVATIRNLKWHYAFARYVTVRAITALEREGRLVRVVIDDDGAEGAERVRIAPMRKRPVAAPKRADAIFYSTGDIQRRLREVREGWEGRTTLLSPFDNLVIDRDRADLLFDFFYRMEIYVPPELRRRGYWAMPILHGDRIVGTVDPRMDREQDRLVVNRVVAEPGAPGGRAVRRAALGAVE